jgi:hypothetical protein
MASRGLLTETDTLGFDPRVRLSGRAMNGFQLNDTVPVLFEEPLDEIEEEIFQ